MFGNIFNEFKAFALRGNVVDLAVGFTVGAAFSTIAKSLVDDIIMPPIGLLVGRTEVSDMFWLLKEGSEQAAPYTTLADAQAAGAVTINYGVFINNVVAFLIVALVMFLLIRGLNRLENAIEDELGYGDEKVEPTTKKCPYCISTIPRRASRCPSCTSELEAAPAQASA